MIPYSKSFIGISLLFRIHGSPLFKAAIPGLISMAIFLLFEYNDWPTSKDDNLNHPYGVGVLISSVSFIIVFRANYGYQRYWNACGDVHHFMSKWLDATVHTSVFHMQQSHYNVIKPPSYYEHHDLNRLNLVRDREMDHNEHTTNGLRNRRKEAKSIEKILPKQSSMRGAKSVRKQGSTNTENSIPYGHNDAEAMRLGQTFSNETQELSISRRHLLSEGRRDGGWGGLFQDGTSTFHDMAQGESSWQAGQRNGFASTHGGRTPSLFLQELAHLASLCNAVAFCTLRNDVEGSESPLGVHFAGANFPEADPDKLPKDVKKDMNMGSRTMTFTKYLLGFDRTPESRTKYNASRPLPVIGGVSDNEIAFLQRAKGPSAKVTLAWHWLSEFIIREHLAGSLGNVGPPIISRLIQFLSDGMIFYNHARKTMYIPFPFPHAQISAFFIFVIMVCVPLLMDEYTTNIYLGSVLTFLTVTCLAGIHEVARELENPFRNVPNEIPLCTLQAMFNESLITMYSGYHPDHYWDGDDYRGRSEVNFSVDTEETKSNSTLGEHPQDSSSSKEEDRHKTMSELRSLIDKQSEEIARLTKLMDDEPSGKNKEDINDNKCWSFNGTTSKKQNVLSLR